MSAHDTSPAAVAAYTNALRTARFRATCQEEQDTYVTAADLLEALAAERDRLAADLAHVTAERDAAVAFRSLDLTGCEWPGCNKPSATYQVNSTWSGHLCLHHSRPSFPGPPTALSDEAPE